MEKVLIFFFFFFCFGLKKKRNRITGPGGWGFPPMGVRGMWGCFGPWYWEHSEVTDAMILLEKKWRGEFFKCETSVVIMVDYFFKQQTWLPKCDSPFFFFFFYLLHLLLSPSLPLSFFFFFCGRIELYFHKHFS